MSDNRTDTDTILELEKRRFRAMRDGDVDVLDALCADELFFMHSNATRDTKSSLLGKIQNQELRCTELVHHLENDVVVVGDTAVATGQVSGTVYVHEHPIELRTRGLAVWARHRGHWRLIAYQSTPNPAR